jgi:hypothetical protein
MSAMGRSACAVWCAAWYATLIVSMGMGAGCSAGPGTAPAAATEGARELGLTGLLTLKGPEREAWWALTDERGVVWRLEPASADQAAQFVQWQNSRVVVDGVRVGSLLLTPQLRVERAHPLR